MLPAPGRAEAASTRHSMAPDAGVMALAQGTGLSGYSTGITVARQRRIRTDFTLRERDAKNDI